MALAKANLGFPQTITQGNTSAVYTVANSKTAYIRGITVHNASVATSSSAVTNSIQIHVVENNSGSVGTASSATRIVRATLAPDDTFVYELQYPIILDTNNDTIQVTNEGVTNSGTATNDITVLVLGDAES